MPRQRNEALAAPRLTSPKYTIPETLHPKLAALFTDMLQGWWNYRFGRRRHKEESIQGDIGTVCDLVKHAGKIPGQLTPADFDRWATHLATKRRVIERTQSKYYSAVRTFLDYVIGNLVLRNQVRQLTGADVIQLITVETGIPHKVPNDAGPNTGRRAFTHEQVSAYFDGLDRSIQFAHIGRLKSLLPLMRDKVIFSLTYATGLRMGEVRRLNVGSFEPNPDFPEFGAWGLVRIYGKGGKWRAVPIMHPQVSMLLQIYYRDVRPLLLARGGNPNEKALFVTEHGKRMSYAAFHDRFKAALYEAGLIDSGHVPHNLRSSSVTHHALNGMDLETLRQMHGHVYAATTQTYMFVPDEIVQDDYNAAISRNLDQAKGTKHELRKTKKKK